MFNIQEFLRIQRRQVENDAVEMGNNWRDILPKIQAHKQELINWNNKIVDEWEGLDAEGQVIEKIEFIKLLDMSPEQISQIMRDYYTKSRGKPPSSTGFTRALETQRQLIETIRGYIRDQKW